METNYKDFNINSDTLHAISALYHSFISSKAKSLNKSYTKFLKTNDRGLTKSDVSKSFFCFTIFINIVEKELENGK